MRIAYIARHGQPNNDDEGAIAHALRTLGHAVDCVPERNFRAASRRPHDLILLHHFPSPTRLKRLGGPKAFWCFDRIEFEGHAARRRAWALEMTAACDIGFMTDGDWVAGDDAGKLHWLTQGFDERQSPWRSPAAAECDVLFFGAAHTPRRQSFVAELRSRYGDRFRYVVNGAHGMRLAKLIAGAKVVVAPDGPVTHRYWSNRLYLTLGLGGFLLHHYSDGVADQYEDESELVLYEGFRDMVEDVDYFLAIAAARREVAESGRERTLREHLYRHRCEQLVRVVKERLGIV